MFACRTDPDISGDNKSTRHFFSAPEYNYTSIPIPKDTSQTRRGNEPG
jgi:hypothetical protein